jgi:hypothetical protein
MRRLHFTVFSLHMSRDGGAITRILYLIYKVLRDNNIPLSNSSAILLGCTNISMYLCLCCISLHLAASRCILSRSTDSFCLFFFSFSSCTLSSCTFQLLSSCFCISVPPLTIESYADTLVTHRSPNSILNLPRLRSVGTTLLINIPVTLLLTAPPTIVVIITRLALVRTLTETVVKPMVVLDVKPLMDIMGIARERVKREEDREIGRVGGGELR